MIDRSSTHCTTRPASVLVLMETRFQASRIFILPRFHWVSLLTGACANRQCFSRQGLSVQGMVGDGWGTGSCLAKVQVQFPSSNYSWPWDLLLPSVKWLVKETVSTCHLWGLALPMSFEGREQAVISSALVHLPGSLARSPQGLLFQLLPAHTPMSRPAFLLSQSSLLRLQSLSCWGRPEGGGEVPGTPPSCPS